MKAALGRTISGALLFAIILSPSIFAESLKNESIEGTALKQLVGAADGKRAMAWDRALHVDLINASEQADYMALLQVIAAKESPHRKVIRHEPLLLRIATDKLGAALLIAQTANDDPQNNSIHDTLSLSLKYANTQNLRIKRGQLSPPVIGPIKTKFGVKKLEGTATDVRHTGVSFDVAQGTEIFSIGKGLVVFAREFSGFGKMVIVDHGSSFHSVYGNLSKINVTQGEEIKSQAKIGESGHAENETPEFYFEIRLEGQAVDPEPFLSL